MRGVQVPEKADILVSELLGSFGDNELSPECLDGAMRFMKRKRSLVHKGIADASSIWHFDPGIVHRTLGADLIVKAVRRRDFVDPASWRSGDALRRHDEPGQHSQRRRWRGRRAVRRAGPAVLAV